MLYTDSSSEAEEDRRASSALKDAMHSKASSAASKGGIADTKAVQRYYGENEVAETYEDMRFSSFFGWVVHTMEVEIVNSLLKKTQPRKLLEVAIGPGRLTKHLSSFGWGVGIDTARNMLNMAQRVLARDRWDLVQATVSHMPFERASFDAVVAFRLLEHFRLPDRQRAYAEIRRVLKPGGVLVLNVNAARGLGRSLKRHLLPIKHMIDYVMARANGELIAYRGKSRAKIFSKLYTADEIKREMLNSGFRVVSKYGVACNLCVQLPFYLLNYAELVLPDGMRRSLRRLASVPFFRLEQSLRTKGRHSLGWIVVTQRVGA